MNIFGTALFVLMAGVSGLFIILAITSDVVVMETTGTIMEGTTWHEDERQNRECAEMGYYYDEYGEEYEECERYEYITYYVCSTNLDFNYTLAEAPDGDVYQAEDTLTWDGSSGPCLQQIKDMYPVNGTLLVYYLSDDPTDASVGKPLEPSGMYFCCGICFGILAIPAGFFMFTNRSAAGRMKTGGMLGRFGPQRVSIAPPINTQQGMPIPGAYGTNTNNVNAGQGRGGGFGGGGMMMVPGMAGGATGYAAMQQTTETIGNVYKLPSTNQAIKYQHAAAGFPTKETWLKAICNSNYDTWPMINVKNVNNHFPESDETQHGHMRAQRQGVRSTKQVIKLEPTCL